MHLRRSNWLHRIRC